MIIYKALLKYGCSNFSLEILEYCEPSKCIEREQYNLDLLKPEYNISLTARAPMTGRNHSEETKLLMSLKKVGEGNSFYGKNHNEETLKKMSEARKGRLRTEGSGRASQKVEVFDLTTDIKTTYDSISDAAIALGVIKSGISMYLNRNTDKPFKGRYILKKINNL
jgi:group I intron endonuclease